METPESPETRAARGGWYRDFATRPSTPAIFQTTAFDVDGLEQLDAITSGREAGYIYTRDGNPNHEALASDVAALEGAALGAVFSSGMGAMTATLLALLKSGDHVVAARVLYGRTAQMLNHLQASFGIEVTYVDGNDPTAFGKAVTPRTHLAIVETISNPLMEVADLPAISAGLGQVPLLVDSTFATPCLVKPMEHGAKLVFHSGSKYLNGHGDVMLGVIVGDTGLVRKIRGIGALYGVNSNPFESWLASRGLRSLPLRMTQVCRTADALARFLTTHPSVLRVYYPGLASHPSHATALQMMPAGFGGMLAFDLRGGQPAVARLFRALGETIPFSPTLADTRTTVSYPAGTSHKFLSAEERATCGITDGLVRLSVGLEDEPTLRRELGAALDSLETNG
ncbi:MAG: aminotransferase class I/II-fold pyridoxal phosphate-dependent enzyme [Planctomycetota bacterium]|nr:aminotransferase class I/II-fold pyridoxal phosphate-dependent enzyme [Planctomycetota bacterium]